MNDRLRNLVIGVIFASCCYLFFVYQNHKMSEEDKELRRQFPLIVTSDCIRDRINAVLSQRHGQPYAQGVYFDSIGQRTIYVKPLRKGYYISNIALTGDSVFKNCNNDTLIIKKKSSDSLFYYKLWLNNY